MKAVIGLAVVVSISAGAVSLGSANGPWLQGDRAEAVHVSAPPETAIDLIMPMRVAAVLNEIQHRRGGSELDHLILETVSRPAGNQAKLDLWLGGEHFVVITAKASPAGSDRSNVTVESELMPIRLTASPHLAAGDLTHLETMVSAVARLLIVRQLNPKQFDEKAAKRELESAVKLPREEWDALFERFGAALLTTYPAAIQHAKEQARQVDQRAYERAYGLAHGSAPPAWQAEEAARRAEEAAR